MDMRFLNEREELVLRTIIDEYVDTSEPVGSRNVSKVGPLKMSPATIRNIMSDLVEKGFIAQPHTSAGRVPTDSGYRYYIDKFVKIQNISENFIENIYREMSIDPVNVMNLFRHFSKKMGDMTHAVGFVVSPKMNTINLKHIEFIWFYNHPKLICMIKPYFRTYKYLHTVFFHTALKQSTDMAFFFKSPQYIS